MIVAKPNFKPEGFDVDVDRLGDHSGVDRCVLLANGDDMVKRRAANSECRASIELRSMSTVHFSPSTIAVGAEPQVGVFGISEQEKLAHFPHGRESNDVLNSFLADDPRCGPGLVLPSQCEFFVVFTIPGVPSSGVTVSGEGLQ